MFSYPSKMGTDSPVAPGSVPNNQPSCSSRLTKTLSKTKSQSTNSTTLNKPSSKTGGTVISNHPLTHSRNQSSTSSLGSTQRTTAVPNKKPSTKKVGFNLNKLSVLQCNLHKAKSAWDSIASSFNDIKHPIFITTEPYHDRNRVIPNVHKDLVHYY